MDCREARKWLAQARHTLEAMDADISAGNYAWACFKAQQAAELALKALIKAGGGVGYGHDLGHLIEEALSFCGEKEVDTGALHGCARLLNRYYIPPRYPDAWPGEVAPFQEYEEGEAVKARKCAEHIIGWVVECLRNCL